MLVLRKFGILFYNLRPWIATESTTSTNMALIFCINILLRRLVGGMMHNRVSNLSIDHMVANLLPWLDMIIGQTALSLHATHKSITRQTSQSMDIIISSEYDKKNSADCDVCSVILFTKGRRKRERKKEMLLLTCCLWLPKSRQHFRVSSVFDNILIKFGRTLAAFQ